MKYTEKELKEAAREAQDSLRAILKEARYSSANDSWTRDELEFAARLAGYTTMMKSMLDSIDKTRKPFTCTLSEMEEAVKSYPFSHISAEWIRKYILDHREPDYPPGTVVLSAAGTWYRRTGSGWVSFGAGDEIPYDFPRRPLTVKS